MLIIIVLILIVGFVYLFKGDKKIELPDIEDFHTHSHDWHDDYDYDDSDSVFDSGSDDE